MEPTQVFYESKICFRRSRTKKSAAEKSLSFPVRTTPKTLATFHGSRIQEILSPGGARGPSFFMSKLTSDRATLRPARLKIHSVGRESRKQPELVRFNTPE